MYQIPSQEDPRTWGWWCSLISVALCNFVMFIIITSITKNSSDPDTRRYQRKMRWLALPFIAQCAWRSFFPCIYNKRQSYFDTPFNGVLVNRTLAAIGEVCLVVQISLVLRHILIETHPTHHNSCWPKYVKSVSYLMVLLVLCAEGFSYTTTATTNHLYGIFEESLWCLLIIIAIPCSVYFYRRCREFTTSETKSIRAFSLILGIGGTSYALFMISNNIPNYVRLWNKDQSEGKVYFGFLSGIRDAAHTRHTTHQWNDWKGDYLWMSLYFSVAVWVSILLSLAPRLHCGKSRRTVNQGVPPLLSGHQVPIYYE